MGERAKKTKRSRGRREFTEKWGSFTGDKNHLLTRGSQKVRGEKTKEEKSRLKSGGGGMKWSKIGPGHGGEPKSVKGLIKD